MRGRARCIYAPAQAGLPRHGTVNVKRQDQFLLGASVVAPSPKKTGPPPPWLRGGGGWRSTAHPARVKAGGGGLASLKPLHTTVVMRCGGMRARLPTLKNASRGADEVMALAASLQSLSAAGVQKSA